MKQALALSALAVLGAASVAPAMAGPYVTTKVGIEGDIEVGPAWETKNDEDTTTAKQIEVGSKIKLTDNLGAKVKAEWTMPDSDDVVEWKYEGTLTYNF
jgi:opacity protein-like surface antigen